MSQPEEYNVPPPLGPQETEPVEKQEFIPLFDEDDLRELSDVFDKED